MNAPPPITPTATSIRVRMTLGKEGWERRWRRRKISKRKLRKMQEHISGRILMKLIGFFLNIRYSRKESDSLEKAKSAFIGCWERTSFFGGGIPEAGGIPSFPSFCPRLLTFVVYWNWQSWFLKNPNSIFGVEREVWLSPTFFSLTFLPSSVFFLHPTFFWSCSLFDSLSFLKNTHQPMNPKAIKASRELQNS